VLRPAVFDYAPRGITCRAAWHQVAKKERVVVDVEMKCFLFDGNF
jgi:hypothetical protein